MKEILKYSNCFVCGEKNIGGLKARFFYDGEKAFTEIEASPDFEGYHGIYHGGVISSLLDEVMIKAILAKDLYVVTAEMTVRYKKPVTVGTRLIVSGQLTHQKGRMFFAEGILKDNTDTIYATATGKYIEADESLRAQLMKSIE